MAVDPWAGCDVTAAWAVASNAVFLARGQVETGRQTPMVTAMWSPAGTAGAQGGSVARRVVETAGWCVGHARDSGSSSAISNLQLCSKCRFYYK